MRLWFPHNMMAVYGYIYCEDNDAATCVISALAKLDDTTQRNITQIVSYKQKSVLMFSTATVSE